MKLNYVFKYYILDNMKLIQICDKDKNVKLDSNLIINYLLNNYYYNDNLSYLQNIIFKFQREFYGKIFNLLLDSKYNCLLYTNNNKMEYLSLKILQYLLKSNKPNKLLYFIYIQNINDKYTYYFISSKYEIWRIVDENEIKIINIPFIIISDNFYDENLFNNNKLLNVYYISKYSKESIKIFDDYKKIYIPHYKLEELNELNKNTIKIEKELIEKSYDLFGGNIDDIIRNITSYFTLLNKKDPDYFNQIQYNVNDFNNKINLSDFSIKYLSPYWYDYMKKIEFDKNNTFTKLYGDIKYQLNIFENVFCYKIEELCFNFINSHIYIDYKSKEFRKRIISLIKSINDDEYNLCLEIYKLTGGELLSDLYKMCVQFVIPYLNFILCKPYYIDGKYTMIYCCKNFLLTTNYKKRLLKENDNNICPKENEYISTELIDFDGILSGFTKTCCFIISNDNKISLSPDINNIVY